MEYYLAIKKNEIVPFAAIWMNLKECHTEWSKSDREGEILYNVPYMWNVKEMIQMNLQKETHRLRKQTYGC